MRASWGLSRWWLPRVRSAGNLGVATRIADIIARCERGGDACMGIAFPPLVCRAAESLCWAFTPC